MFPKAHSQQSSCPAAPNPMPPMSPEADNVIATETEHPDLNYRQQHHHRRRQVHSDQSLSFTILWSPLPPITWLIPFIGHLGIATSDGTACDFQGPYFVGDSGRMAFGRPTRAVTIDVKDLADGPSRWDGAIQEANEEYRGRMHNICCDNCHSHVAYALNRMEGLRGPFGIRTEWNMVNLCFLVFFKGRFLRPYFGGLVCQFGPFVAVVLLITLIKSAA
uniref:Transmembrane protein 222 n=1 Tax=Helicotheca tamesis TaxID=374047 RepID=A0A7S2DZ12_9STRA